MGVKIGADTVRSPDSGIRLPGFDFRILTNLLCDLGPSLTLPGPQILHLKWGYY